jgi:nuclear migration protein JNM1
MEEIRTEMINKNKPDTELIEWDSLIRSFTPENTTQQLTTRLQKLNVTTPTSLQKSTYTLSYSPTETTQLSSLSSRLSTLETTLGLPLSTQTHPILPTISHLSSKLDLLTSNTHLESLQTRLKSLTKELNTLEEKREQARQRALLDPEDFPLQLPSEPNSEKINALYSSLEHIDRISPLLPGILDRLRGMAVVHADAVGVTTGIKDVRETLGRMEKEVREWELSIKSVESGLKGVEGRVSGVLERVEQVISGLEGRVEKLGM